MEVSLEQAIEIHGKALKYRKGARAGAAIAAEQADRCRAKGDDEGFDVWLRVRNVIDRCDDERETNSSTN
jgi:hypothetical protein